MGSLLRILALLPLALSAPAFAAPAVEEAGTTEAVERHLPGDGFTRWSHDPALLETQSLARRER